MTITPKDLEILRKNIDIRMILDDFSVPRTNNNCRCPFPFHEDKHFSAIIHDAGWDRDHVKYYDHPSLYCMVDKIKWDNIELYCTLKGYEYRNDFKKIVSEMQERYLSDKYKDEIAAKRSSETSEIQRLPKFETREDEQEYINKLLNNELPEYLVTSYDVLRAKYSDNKDYIGQFLRCRCLEPEFAQIMLKKAGIDMYHSYDRAYKSNNIYYVITWDDGNKSIIKKRIDAYLPKNKGKSIRKFKMNIGKMEPVFIPAMEYDENQRMLIICEGLEDALSAAWIVRKAEVVSLNSTKQIPHFRQTFLSKQDAYKSYKIMLAFDNDSQGQKECKELMDWFVNIGFKLNVNLFTYCYLSNDSKDVNEDLIYANKNELLKKC